MMFSEQQGSNQAATAVAGVQAGGHYVALPTKTEDGEVVGHAVQTIRREPEELYRLWSDLESIPRWQEFVVSVTDLGGGKSHWVMGDPDDEKGKRVEFDSVLEADVPGQRITWRSVTKGVDQSGTVTFAAAENGRGTLVTLIQTSKVPGGSLGNAAASVAKRSPKQIVIEDLRHFKELAESGEIPSVVDQPHGPRGAIGNFKRWALGETNPTPTGTSTRA